MNTITVIVPAYNCEKTIARCVESLCCQICNRGGYGIEYQVVIINDGSTDRTGGILKELSRQNPLLRVFTIPNSGPAMARKYGIDHSKSDYLAFCDADDYVDSDWLISLYENLKKYDADISVCSAYIDDIAVKPENADGRIIEWCKEDSLSAFLEHKDLNGILWTKLFKRRLFENLEWNSDIRIFEDALLIWQILFKANKIVKFQLPKYHYMILGDSLTNRSYDGVRFFSHKIFAETLVGDCAGLGKKCLTAKAKDLQYVMMASLLKEHILARYPNIVNRDYMVDILRKGGIRRYLKLLDWKRKIFCGVMIMFPNLGTRLLPKIGK